MRAYIERQVNGGFESGADILKGTILAYTDELKPAEVRRLARPMIDQAKTAHAAAQARWPKVTDCDRLDRAFEVLDRSGIVARQNYSCCGNCAAVEIVDEITWLRKKKKKHVIRGYAMYDEQGTDAAIAGHGIMLDCGATPWSGTDSAAIGREVVKALRAEGLRPKGNSSTGIHLPISWKRRCPR